MILIEPSPARPTGRRIVKHLPARWKTVFATGFGHLGVPVVLRRMH